MSDDPIAGWEVGAFTYHHHSFPTFRKGSGPGVVVIHEIPGITPKVIGFADEVVAAGFTVVMPLLLGEAGRAPSLRYVASSFLKACVAKEFTVWATGSTSPVVEPLRALARQLHAELGGPGVGAVGMCFSGGFALAMAVDEALAAPVMSQPSLPLAVGSARSADLGLSPVDLAAVKRRVADGCQVMGLRYRGDRAVGTRFATLRRELGDGFIAVEFDGSKHSVLTEHRQQEGVERVLAFLRERLLV